MIINNENKKLSSNGKKRNEGKKIDDKMKSLIIRIKSEMKEKIKFLMKLKN